MGEYEASNQKKLDIAFVSMGDYLPQIQKVWMKMKSQTKIKIIAYVSTGDYLSEPSLLQYKKYG